MTGNATARAYVDNLDLAYSDWEKEFQGEAGMSLPGSPVSGVSPAERFQAWYERFAGALYRGICPTYVANRERIADTIETVAVVKDLLGTLGIPVIAPLATAAILTQKYLEHLCGPKDEGTSVVVDGRRLFFQTAGRGAPVLFLHGIPSSSFVWRQLVPLLARDCHLILPDLLGFGRSEKSFDCDFSIPAQARALEGLLRESHAAPAHLVAHDLGACVALYLLSTTPGLVRSLTILNTSDSTRWMVAPITRIRDCEDQELQPRVEKLLSLGMERAILNPAARTPEVLAAYARPFQGAAGAFHFRSVLRALRPEDLQKAESLIAGMPVRTRVLWGLRDTNLPVAVGEHLCKLLPNSSITKFEDAGHFIQEDQPEKVANEIRALIHQP
jgi:2-hydroxymuconate-semialdehyde hydrolase